jgi:hypothetical protein
LSKNWRAKLGFYEIAFKADKLAEADVSGLRIAHL